MCKQNILKVTNYGARVQSSGVHMLGMVGDQRVCDTGHTTPFSYFRRQDATMVGPTLDS